MRWRARGAIAWSVCGNLWVLCSPASRRGDPVTLTFAGVFDNFLKKGPLAQLVRAADS